MDENSSLIGLTYEFVDDLFGCLLAALVVVLKRDLPLKSPRDDADLAHLSIELIEPIGATFGNRCPIDGLHLRNSGFAVRNNFLSFWT